MNDYLIIVTGYNCGELAYKCYNSLKRLYLHEWRAIFISDGSTDNTSEYLSFINDSRVIIERYRDNRGAAYRRYNAITQYGKKDDIIILVGMDDELRRNALNIISGQYNEGKLMTYGNWIDQYNKILPDGFLQFDKITHSNRDYRKVKYRSTAPNTFRKFLFDKLKPEDFMFKGEWIKATTESPLMFACLEMCGEKRIGVIEEPIYFYRKRTDNARRRFGDNYQDMIYADVISRPKFDLI